MVRWREQRCIRGLRAHAVEPGHLEAKGQEVEEKGEAAVLAEIGTLVDELTSAINS